jgi:uncharacterized protein (TIGR00730 family)
LRWLASRIRARRANDRCRDARASRKKNRPVAGGIELALGARMSTITSSKSILALAAGAALLACVAPTSSDSTPTDTSSDEVVSGAVRVYLSPHKCQAPGEYVASGVTATPAQVALDAYCGELVTKRAAPQGYVVMFGSSRLADGTPEYANARDFASQWTSANTGFPIMTGGGPGLMEAGNRGAAEAGGPSLGFSTYFKASTDALNTFVSDGYMFSDFETRERAMLRGAKAAVIYWGGAGTAWELFMTISDVQTKRLNKIPIVLVGKDFTDVLKPYLEWMVAKGTISQPDVDQLVFVETAADTVTAVKAGLGLP